MMQELQTVLSAVHAMQPEQLPKLLGQLEEIRAPAVMRLSSLAPAPSQPDRLIDVKEAAERLGISANFLYRNSRRYPFTRREGRKVLFSSVGIDRYIAQKGR